MSPKCTYPLSFAKVYSAAGILTIDQDAGVETSTAAKGIVRAHKGDRHGHNLYRGRDQELRV